MSDSVSGSVSSTTHTYDHPSSLSSGTTFETTGWTHTGWGVLKDAATREGDYYSFGDAGKVTNGEGVTVLNLTAVDNGTFSMSSVWSAHEYEITYDPNEPEGMEGLATGSVADTTHIYDHVCKSPSEICRAGAFGEHTNDCEYISSESYTLPGWRQIGWNTEADLSGGFYAFGDAGGATNGDGQTVINLGSRTLYAVWEIVCTHPECDYIYVDEHTHDKVCTNCGYTESESHDHYWEYTYVGNKDGTTIYEKTLSATHKVIRTCICEKENVRFVEIYKDAESCTEGSSFTYAWEDNDSHIAFSHCEYCEDAMWANGGLVHEYSDGKCIKCEWICVHSYDNGVCTICGTVCSHYGTLVFEGNGNNTHKVIMVCTICNSSSISFEAYECTRSAYYMYEATDNWYHREYKTCTHCDNILEDIYTALHDYNNGVCSECGWRCGHSYSDGYCITCNYVCSNHNWGAYEFSGNGDGTHRVTQSCTICGTIQTYAESLNCTQGAYVYTQYDGVQHKKTANCEACGSEMVVNGKENHNWSDGVCTDCGYRCTHPYTDSWAAGTSQNCEICGKYVPATSSTNSAYVFMNRQLPGTTTENSTALAKADIPINKVYIKDTLWVKPEYYYERKIYIT